MVGHQLGDGVPWASRPIYTWIGVVPNKDMRMRDEKLKYGHGNEHPDLSAEVYTVQILQELVKDWGGIKMDGSTAGWMMDAGT